MKIYKITNDGLTLMVNLAHAHKELVRMGSKSTREELRHYLNKKGAVKLSTIHGDIIYTTDPSLDPTKI